MTPRGVWGQRLRDRPFAFVQSCLGRRRIFCSGSSLSSHADRVTGSQQLQPTTIKKPPKILLDLNQ
jgi:hypothetical protein